MRSLPFLSRWSAVSAGSVLVSVRAGALCSHTVQRDKEADGALRNPLADAIAGALLYAGDQGGVVNYAVEYLALGRFGCTHGGGGTGPGRVRAAAHGGWAMRGTSECCERVAVVLGVYEYV